MLKGRPFSDASHITSRICGICAVGHATASLRATENALGIDPSPQTKLLRRLNFLGEMLDSHVLHAYMLVAPDFLNVGSVIPLAKIAPDVVLRALRMKKLAGDTCKAIAGRHTHPIAMTVGGFTHFPTAADLYELRERYEEARADVAETIALFQTLPIPQFTRHTEYIALRNAPHYGFIDGEIVSTDGGVWPIELYRDVTNEYVVAQSVISNRLSVDGLPITDYRLPNILVLSLGNPLRGDDGVGTAVLSKLAAHSTIPDGVVLLDGGTPGLETVLLLEGYERAIIIDAADMGLEPGNWRRWRRRWRWGRRKEPPFSLFASLHLCIFALKNQVDHRVLV